MEQRISRKRFIRLGGAVGVGAAGASILAACGGGETGGEQGGATEAAGERTAGGERAAGGERTAEQAPGGQVIAQTSNVEPGTAVEFTDNGQPALLIHLQNGDFVAYSAVCTHQQCTVAYQPEQNIIACPCHGSVFNPSNNAQVVNGPAAAPLPSIPVEVRGGEVLKA